MRIVEMRRDGVVTVAPDGRIDTTTAPELERHLFAIVAGGEQRIVVDLSGVDYISSAGLRVMLLFARRVKDAGGRLALCAMGDAVRQVFHLAGFLPLFTVCDSPAAAVRQAAAT